MGLDVNPNSRAPLNSGSANQPGDPVGLGKSIDGLAGLYRYNHDRSQALGQAVEKLRGQPPGTAVVITESATTYGNKAFGGTHYDGTTVGRTQSIESALREVNGERVNAPNKVSNSYVVYTGNENVCPANTGKASIMSMEEANRLR